MSAQITRRETLRRSLTAAGILAIADRAVPALAQGETDLPFTDSPANFAVGGNGFPRRTFDHRTLDGLIVPKDKFFVTQHYNQPEISPDNYRLKLTGMVKKPMELSLADLRKMHPTEMIIGYECSGNRPASFQGLSSCGRFTGVPLRQILNQTGVGPKAREVVFFGNDRGEQEIVFRQQTFKLNQQFGRSVTL